MSGTTTGGGGHPAEIRGHGRTAPLTESEFQALLEWLKANHPGVYDLLTRT